MLAAVAAAVAAPAAVTAAVGDQPSFLFILGDDIGWADFRCKSVASVPVFAQRIVR